MSNIRI